MRQLALYENGEVHCALGESTGQHGEPSEGAGKQWGFRDGEGPLRPFHVGAGTQWGFHDGVGPLQPFHVSVGTQYALYEDSRSNHAFCEGVVDMCCADCEIVATHSSFCEGGLGECLVC